MLRKVAYAGAQSASFVQATKDLEALAETEVSRERVQRWTKRVGVERVEQRREQAAAYQALPLPARRESPTGQAPQVACVMMDGGRIQVRDRQAESDDAKSCRKESLIGCCLSMTSREHAEDPCPKIPKTFVDPQRMGDLSREIKGFVGDREAGAPPPTEAPEDRSGRPEVLVKSVVATREGGGAFGERLIAEAHARGFNAAQRKAFVADDAAANWGVHKKHFSHDTPIVDFTHVVCYVDEAATAGRNGWRDYAQWAQWLWEGASDKLSTAVRERSEQLGPPPDGDEASPAAVVARTLTYLNNQRSRRNYPRYRKLGPPITSSHIESTSKQVNRRVNGTEKFWDQGAEPMLQLAADHLSDTNEFQRFWRRRSQRLQAMRCYQTAA